MMRQPAVRRAARGLRKALSDFLTAPTGGWNTRDPLDRMRPADAVVLENWYPRPGSVDLRGGARSHVTGFGEAPERLMAWVGPADSKLFAATQEGIYEASAAGTAGAAVMAVTSSNFSWTNFAVLGGAYLIAVNGEDALLQFDGTTWASITGVGAISITGVPTTELTSVVALHRRLWFTRAGSSSAYYLPVAQIGGALVEFPLGQVFSDGGHLAAIGSWSSDPGAGQDDYTVFVSSEGELAIYRGYDPSDASNFTKVGVFPVAAPVGGHRCLARLGGDLLLLCELGLFRLSQILSEKGQITSELALTDKINRAFATAVAAHRTNAHWQVIAYPGEQALLVNIPVTNSYSEQYVMNTQTGAWSRFVGWGVQGMALFERRLYAASLIGVSQLWAGVDDWSAAIRGRLQLAYNYFGTRGDRKHVKLISPSLQTTTAVNGALGVDVDFAMAGVFGAAAVNPPAGALWDVDSWDDAYWAGDFTMSSGWVSVSAPEGFAHSLLYRVETRTAQLKLLGFNVAGQKGGPL